jgi:hypothetical protein
MKKIIALFIAIHLIIGGLMPSINIILNFDLIKSNYLMAGPITEVCIDKDTEEYFPITDERGNSVLTKKEFNRDCTLTKEVQGACIKWETLKEDFVIDAEDYDAYRSRNHEGAMGSLLAMIGAYDQLEHLWSGWKGYCEIGTKTNFDWASDPMFWAGLVASAIMDGSKASDLAGASDAAVAASEAAGATTESIMAAWETSLNQSKGFMADTALGQGIQGMQNSMAGALGPLSTWIGPASGQCLMATGFDLGKSLYQYAGSNESDDMCDSVDEFCGDTATQTEESDIITIDKQQYEDMIAKHPDFADYIIILNEENGILTVRYKNMNEMESYQNMNQAEMDKLKEQMKQMQLVMTAVITAGKIASCFTPAASTNVSTSTPAGEEGFLSIKNGLGMGISMIPAEWLGPAGIFIKAALQIMLNFLYSFNDVNTCTNEDDADQAGNRHKKTYEALPHDLCYFVYDKCVDNCGDSFFGLAKELRGYNYCCYDQILTKVLIVQLKAQLGRDWAHCTGVTLRDLNFVSFRQCTETEKANGIDGGQPGLGNIGAGDSGPKPPEQGGYDPTKTFQYKNKCIDLTEFKEYLKAQIGDNIDLSDFDSIFNDVKGQAGGL